MNTKTIKSKLDKIGIDGMEQFINLSSEVADLLFMQFSNTIKNILNNLGASREAYTNTMNDFEDKCYDVAEVVIGSLRGKNIGGDM